MDVIFRNRFATIQFWLVNTKTRSSDCDRVVKGAKWIYISIFVSLFLPTEGGTQGQKEKKDMVNFVLSISKVHLLIGTSMRCYIPPPPSQRKKREVIAFPMTDTR